MAPSKLNTKTFPSIPYWYSVTTKMTAELLRRCSLRARTTYQHLSVESVIVNHLTAKAMHDIDALKVRASEMGRPLKPFAWETKISGLKYSDETRFMALPKRPIVFQS